MKAVRIDRWRRLVLALALVPALTLAQGTLESNDYTPEIGQEGKDVIWVPTPDFLVERMLQMAQVGPDDLVIDLGSGDGRTVIMAAKKYHANSAGIEFNPSMVALSRKNAEKAGVSATAKFIEGDIFATNFSKATVVTMYLLPDLNLRLRPKLLEMKPGTRLVSHQFSMGEWRPDEVSSYEGRTAMLWIVPAAVEGNWTLSYATEKGKAELTMNLTQKFQMVEGGILAGSARLGLRSVALQGDRLDFSFVDGDGVLREFSGIVRGNAIAGSMKVAGRPSVRFRADKAA